jgi:hypothetical protein
MSRAFLRVVSKKRHSTFRPRSRAYRDASHRWLASGHIFEAFSKQFVPRQKFVQQHSGDWTMTGKVPVARVEGEMPLPRTKSEG